MALACMLLLNVAACGNASTANDTNTVSDVGAETGTSADTDTPVNEAASADADTTADAAREGGNTASAAESAAPQAETSSDDSLDGTGLAAVRDQIITSLQITDYAEMDNGRLLDVYGIEEADLTQSASFVIMSGAYPYEIVLVEAVDDAAAGRIAEKLQARLDEVRNQYKDYDAEAYAMAQKCSVDTDGLTVSLFLSPERDTMRKILTDALA